MAIKDTTKSLKSLLQQIINDLDKAERGNKAASQRVRTGTVKLEKTAKTYRKESIKTEKQQPKSKTASKYQVKLGKGAKPKAMATVSASKAKAPAAKSKSAPAPKAKPKAAAPTKKATARPRALAFQRQPTAKLPTSWS